jgi:hypothetical protein
VRRFFGFLESVVGALARLEKSSLAQEVVALFGQGHDFDGIVLSIQDRFDFGQFLTLEVFDIPFHSAPVAVVCEFRKVVMSHYAELSHFRKQINIGVSEFVSLIAVPKNGTNPLRQNLSDALLAMKRCTLLPWTVSALSVACISALFFSMEFAEADPQTPKRIRASTCATIGIFGAAEIFAVKDIKAASHSDTSNSGAHSG